MVSRVGATSDLASVCLSVGRCLRIGTQFCVVFSTTDLVSSVGPVATGRMGNGCSIYSCNLMMDGAGLRENQLSIGSRGDDGATDHGVGPQMGFGNYRQRFSRNVFIYQRNFGGKYQLLDCVSK